jgi:hypothetical protein
MSFEFTHEGRVHRVHSVVGDGLTKFVWQTLDEPEPKSLDTSEES